MKTLKTLSILTLAVLMLGSCSRDGYYDEPASLNQLLNSYDLWYVDLDQTLGYGETPFLQMAFTVSFRNGLLYANNNLAGFGSQGDGFGIVVGEYDAYDMILDVYHDIDGYDSFDVYQIDNNTIELYNPFDDTSYFLEGYQRSNFDYDMVFYNNIHYFLQEYEAWEKTAVYGGIENAFDSENYLQFVSGGSDDTFRSSQDVDMGNPNNIYWDFTGYYGVSNVSNNAYLKHLTLNYDTSGSEQFELNVVNDQVIELYHLSSETVYEFTGRGYIQYMKTAEGKLTNRPKMRKRTGKKTDNPRENTRIK